MKLLRIILIAVLVQSGLAQSPAPASVRGSVVGAETSEPLVNAIVELRDATGTAGPKATTLTRDNGAFAFPNVAPGRYRIVVTRNGYASKQGSPIAVSAGQQVVSPPMTLSAGATVSGRIAYANGDPMPIAGVSILKAGYADDGSPSFTEIQSQVTNDLGEYRMFWLPAGSYYLRARSAQNNMQTSILMNPNGNGVLTALGMIGTSRQTAPVTSALGIEDGQTYVSIYYPGTQDSDRATPLDLRPGGELRNINITMTPATMIRVRGMAFDQVNQKPIQGFTIASIRSLDAGSGGGISGLQFNSPGGGFDFREVYSGGTYEVRASADGLAGRIVTDIRGRDIEVSVPMFAPVRLAGKVKVEGGTGSLSGVTVSIGTSAAVAANGDFAIPSIAVASYPVTVKFPPAMPDAYVQSIRYQDNDVLNSDLIIDGNPPGSLDVVINIAGGSIDGRVANSRGDIVPNATVLLIPDQAAPIRPDRYRTGSTNELGKFQFHALPPGDYFLYAWSDIEKNAWFGPTFLRGFDSSRQSIHIASGQKLELAVTAVP